MELTSYQALIQSLPVKQQIFTTKRSNWIIAESEIPWLRVLNDKLFQGQEILKLSRHDLLTQQRPLRELIIATIYWGYPKGKRGHNFINILRDIESIEAALNTIKDISNPNTSDFSTLVRTLSKVKGLGISTYSKILYFMGIRFNGTPCQILDLRLMEVFGSGMFKEFNALKGVIYRTAHHHYLTYLSIISQVAYKLNTRGENVEQFLFIFGRNLKVPEGESSSHGTMFNDEYCPECELNDESVDLRLNEDDLYECPKCSLQLAVNTVQGVILRSRGIGRFRNFPVPNFGSDSIDGVILTRAKGDTTESDSTTFNSEHELREYLDNEVESQLELSYENLIATYANMKFGNPFTYENSPLPYKRQSRYLKVDFDNKNIIKKLEKRDKDEQRNHYQSYKHLHRLLMSLFEKYYDADVSWLPEMGMSQAEVDLCRKHLRLIPEPVTETSDPFYKKQRLMALMLDLTKIIYHGRDIEIANANYIYTPEPSL